MKTKIWEVSETLKEEAIPNTNSHDAKQVDGTDCFEKTGFDWKALEQRLQIAMQVQSLKKTIYGKP